MQRISVRDILAKKGREPIVMVTAYDYPFARIVDEAGVDMILVGDSAAMVVHGLPNTNMATMQMMLLHTAAVSRGAKRAMVVADMPFGSYEASRSEAVKNAIKFVRVGADAVKLEGGVEVADKIEAITKAGIPVVGHIGLTPQKRLMLGGYRRRGRTVEDAERLLEDAKAVEEAGAFAIVIEFTAEEVAAEITRKLKIPTICIGSGRHCDGQVLVLHDILGLSETIPPFAEKYADLRSIALEAVRRFAADVREGRFPREKHVFHMKETWRRDRE
ncbi:3-methyl-2-oxobutanoatehydroxymethyltransferase [Pyrolobus fumarii 1A]|uniref:3-methyl-2-oxobutanoate hydroxymethyltransferase n=1 Tax=Pyrolobus fumarii (strain DSM 11204 / 1A) TaxID=694429 RepID=G0EFC1_PYRF1|nr:3-methyl-2-oxobutanoate hydroxymethyltransferase [Pyrolobus fumarii]AEM38164.1 3-methyl-2-oxobutanoatehydroxymethyltransferase [Pyrolobus fumarii 1A]